MTFGDDMASTLVELRELAESLMIDTCKVTRIRRDDTGQPITAIDTDGVVTEVRDEVYVGKAKRQAGQAQERNPEAGGNTFTIQQYAAHFPAESFRAEVGDDIEWITCPFDAGRVGSHDRITGPFGKTLATAMRVTVEEGAS